MRRAAYCLAVGAAVIVIAWPPAWPVAAVVGFLALAARGWAGRDRCECCGGWTLAGIGRHDEACMWWDRAAGAHHGCPNPWHRADLPPMGNCVDCGQPVGGQR